MPDACLYTRISSDPNADGDDGGMGVARQEQDCRALAERLGCTVAHVYTDNDISAYSGRARPAFEDMLDGIKRGQYDVLICWHTDRLYRSIKDMERVIEICDTAGVPIRTVNGGDLDLSNATGKAVARILGSVSRMESEHKAERQRRANLQRAEAGGWWSSHRVFGFNKDATICEPEAALIREAAADVLAGVSLRAIGRRWNEAGMTSSRGAQWNTSRLKRLLINPRYAGLRTYHGKVTGPGDWPAILDADTHHGLTAVLRDSSRSTAVSYERKYIGSYRYACGLCGAPMQHTVSTHAGGRTFHRYACTAAAHLSRTQPELDAYVEAVALAYLRDDTKLAALLAEQSETVDVGGLRTRRAALVAQKDELATLFADGVLDGPAVRRESAKLTAKIAGIDTALAEQARRSPVADLVKDGPERIEKRWAALSPDLKGKIIDELFTVRVNPSPKGRYFRPECIDIVWTRDGEGSE
jgi:site-specific DNA recombinase